MATETRDIDSPVPTVGADAQPLSRYSAVRVNEDELIVYHDDREEAWVQSDTWCDLEELR